MTSPESLHVIVHGHVQGVFFRSFVVKKAEQLGLTGYVCNLSSGQDLEVRAEGERERLDSLIVSLKTGPPGAKVKDIKATLSKYTGEYTDFTIRY